MIDETKLEGRIVRLIAIAVGSYFAYSTGYISRSFIDSFLGGDWRIDLSLFIEIDLGIDFDFLAFYSRFISFLSIIVTGILFGLGLWVIFKKTIMKLLIYTPVLLMLGKYLHLGSIGQARFSPYNILSTYQGILDIVAIPIIVSMTILYLERKSLDKENNEKP